MRVATYVAGAIASLGAAVSAAPTYSPLALKDEITNLPGAPAHGFKMFSGYIDVTNDKKLFYWFVEAETDAETAPVMLWTNGGPGCSGLGGFFTEQGPFRTTATNDLEANEYAWNKLANMVFIEQPAGVGFSESAHGFTNYTDYNSAVDMNVFAAGFFDKFSDYKTNDFYITSESYGGHYMPYLAKEIYTQGQVPNFKGVKLGNPITFMEDRNYGEIGTFYGHQLLDKPTWDQYVANDCHKLANANTNACVKATNHAESLVQHVDPYALDFPVCTGDALGQQERLHLLRKIKPESNLVSAYEPCADDYTSKYLNRADVQSAIHVQGHVRWGLCSGTVGQYYSQDDVNHSVIPLWHWLLNNTDGRFLIYSGDDDSVCATMGTQQFIWDMGLRIIKEWAPRLVNQQLAGYDVEWATGSKAKWGLSTVHGAGHMVPQTQPVRSLALLKQFLDGDIL